MSFQEKRKESLSDNSNLEPSINHDEEGCCFHKLGSKKIEVPGQEGYRQQKNPIRLNQCQHCLLSFIRLNSNPFSLFDTP